MELQPSLNGFQRRHIGPDTDEVEAMLASLGMGSLEELSDTVIPAKIRMKGELDLPAPLTERDALEALRARARENKQFRSYIGLGYSNTLTPNVLLRNLIENPGWYTAYTPYQAEISQGRLEALLVYQTMIQDLTGLEIANASLLDEATAAAEAMAMSYRLAKGKVSTYFVSQRCHPQTVAVLQTRAVPLGIELLMGDHRNFDFTTPIFGALLQYPDTDGQVCNYEAFCSAAHEHRALVTVATDLLALSVLRPPGEFGADIAVGNSQRFGVPLGFGGPHAAFMATRESFKRQMPGRVIGVSRDSDGQPALRMALQTREQHIRRQKATSNICTAQVLLAVVAGMYGAWHGPAGITNIGNRVHRYTSILAKGLGDAEYEILNDEWFDTLRVRVGADAAAIVARAEARQMNLRDYGDGTLGVALDETVRDGDLEDLLAVFECPGLAIIGVVESPIDDANRRTSKFMQHEVFSRYQSETKMMRYLHRLASKDLALNTSMIPLGSCTMKLNAAAEMIPVTWSEFSGIHPFVPPEQARGYHQLFDELESWLAEITGFSAVSLQPNAGSQGEFAGLMVIRSFHRERGDLERNICLIPTSAHGTNPASAVMAGMKVMPVSCDDYGNIDLADLREKAQANSANLAALMITYPSTHGVFEETIREICATIHEHGGQVYMDGANMNAMVGLCRPGDIGADVCHLNLHKTFCIPHGGGGPGMGPIGVAAHLRPYLPGHSVVALDTQGPSISAAPWGSPSILPISWAYIAMMGADGLKAASEIAILNANYIAARVKKAFPILYTGNRGLVAHECILDVRPFKTSCGVSVDDVAKRLIDYGFHAPTMSWPVIGTLMVEPTESEDKGELDRFCDALIAIRGEIQAIEDGASVEDSALRHAPHTADCVMRDEWNHGYSRESAVYPAPWLREHKYWPSVRRVDNAWGDRNLHCSCIVDWPAQD